MIYTIKTVRMINNEITTQVTRKLDEIKSDLNSQVLETINTAIAEKVLPTIQDTPSKQVKGNFTVVDRRSGGLHRDPDTRNARETLEDCPRTGLKLSNRIHSSKDDSVDSHTSETDHFIKLLRFEEIVYYTKTLQMTKLYSERSKQERLL